MPETFSYFPESGGNLPSVHRSAVAGAAAGEPWILGTEAMMQQGQRDRQRAIQVARLGAGQVAFRERASSATEPAIDAWRPSDPALLAGLDQGDFQYAAWPGDLILPEVLVQATQGTNGSLSIEIPTWGTEHFEVHETDRPIGASYNFIQADPTTTTQKLLLKGIAAKKDIRVVRKADSFLNISGRHAALALRALQLGREVAIRNLVQTTGSYTASHATALTTEWDHASGNSKGDWDTLFATMLASSGIPRQLMTITLCSYDALQAAYDDPTFIAQRTSTLGTSPQAADLQELARYWQVRRVNVADCRARISGTIQSLWGDVAVAHWAGDTAGGIDVGGLSLEDFMGMPLMGATFTGNPGIAAVPYESRDGGETAMVWPVDTAYVPAITNYSTIGILTNVKE